MQCSAGTHPGRRGSQAGSCGANPSADGVIANSPAFLVCVLEHSVVFGFWSCSDVSQPLELHLGAPLSSLLLSPLQRIYGGLFVG